jgi:tRNA (guanine-N7-)-methyltransferase
MLWSPIVKKANRVTAPALAPGQVEYEFGIPIPGVILPKESWAHTAIKRLPEAGPIDWAAVFGRDAPLCLDIGCGNGRFTLASGVSRPDWNHVAIDSLPTVIRYATRRANQRGLANSRFLAVDGWRLLHDFSSDQSWSEIHVYHPQPYADPRMESRRMLTPDFLYLIHRRLRDRGRLFVQTDRAAYWNYMSTVLEQVFEWEPISSEWPDEPEFRSRREIQARKQGLKIYRGIATRRSDWSDSQLLETIAQLPQPRFKV